jgi:hypothetical protein
MEAIKMTNNITLVKNLFKHFKDIIKTSIEKKNKKKLKNIVSGDVIVPNLFDGTHRQLLNYNKLVRDPELKEIIDFLGPDDYDIHENMENFLVNWLDSEGLNEKK